MLLMLLEIKNSYLYRRHCTLLDIFFEPILHCSHTDSWICIIFHSFGKSMFLEKSYLHIRFTMGNLFYHKSIKKLFDIRIYKMSYHTSTWRIMTISNFKVLWAIFGTKATPILRHRVITMSRSNSVSVTTCYKAVWPRMPFAPFSINRKIRFL